MVVGDECAQECEGERGRPCACARRNVKEREGERRSAGRSEIDEHPRRL